MSVRMHIPIDRLGSKPNIRTPRYTIRSRTQSVSMRIYVHSYAWRSSHVVNQEQERAPLEGSLLDEMGNQIEMQQVNLLDEWVKT